MAANGSDRSEIRPFHFFSRVRGSNPVADITSIITQRERTICTISDTECPVVVPRRNTSGGKWFSYCYIHSLFSLKSHQKKERKKKKNGLVSLSTVEAAPKTIVRTLFDNKIAERRDRLWRIKKRTDIYPREDKN